MAMEMDKIEAKRKMKTGLEEFNFLIYRKKLKLEKPSIATNKELGGYVGEVEFQGHRLQSKGPNKKGVRDDLCDKMISMVNDKETYTGKKNDRGPSSLQHQLRKHM